MIPNRFIKPLTHIGFFVLVLGILVGCENEPISISSTAPKILTESPTLVPQPVDPAQPDDENQCECTTEPTADAPLTYDPLTARFVMFEFLGFVRETAKCDLPCWGPGWKRIEPGKTSFIKMVDFFGAFREVAHRRYLDMENEFDFLDMSFFPPGLFVSIEYSAEQDIIDQLTIRTEMREELLFRRDWDNPLYFEILADYRLHQILAELGPPSEIYIRSFSPGPEWFNTTTLLFYPNMGVIMEYESENDLVEEGEQSYTATCPAKSFISFHLYDPAKERDIADLFEIPKFEDRFKPIETISDMSVEEFSDAFAGADCDVPFLTPTELWPDNPNE